MADEGTSRGPAAVLHDLLTAGTFISYYSETGKLLDFVAAALRSVPGVVGCRFDRAGDLEDAGGAASYTITIQSALTRYGQAILTISDQELFQEYQAAVHNLINSVALRLENLQHQTKLEQHIREQTRELELNRAFLESVLENTGDAISVVDHNFQIIRANRAAQELADYACGMLGEEPQSLTGTTCFGPFYAAHHSCDMSPAAQALKTGTIQEQIAPFPDRDRPERWLAVSAFPVVNESGDVMHVIESARDITPLKQAQGDLSRLLKEKDLLLQEVYHRVKNNLNLAVSILSLQFSGFKDPQIAAV